MLKRAFFTMSSGIILSRIFGFIRDLLFASILGAGIYTDIFFVSFKLTNLLRRIFAEGTFTQAFLPRFIKSPEKALFSISIFLYMLGVIIAISLVIALFPYPLTKLLALGMDDAHVVEAASLLRIMFWYLALIFITTFCCSILQYRGCFYPNAYGTILLNLALIVALLFTRHSQPVIIIYALSIAVVAGGAMQVLLSLFAMYKRRLFRFFYLGVRRLKERGLGAQREHIARFNASFLPAILGSSTAQICAFCDTLLASFLHTGSISYLYYANRVFQLPLAIFAIAISSAIFPSIAKALAHDDTTRAFALMRTALYFLLGTLGACVIGGVYLRREIIELLFMRGAFSSMDALSTAGIFGAYLVGLLPFGLAKLFSLYLYSYNKQALAAIYSSISLVFSLCLSLVLMRYLGAFGLALSSSLGGVLLLLLNLYAFGFKNLRALWSSRYLVYAIAFIALVSALLPVLKMAARWLLEVI